MKSPLRTMHILSGALLTAGLPLVLPAVEVDFRIEGAPTAEALTPRHPRMTSDFAELVDELRAESTTAGRSRLATLHGPHRFDPKFKLDDSGSRLQGYIWLSHWDDATLKALEAAGAELLFKDERRRLVEAWLPLDRMEEVAAVPGVRQLRRPSYAIPAMGSVITEGDTNIGTNFVRAIAEANGNGVKVGVLSVGLGSIPASGSNQDSRVRSGDLPKDENSVLGATFGFLGAIQITPLSFAFHSGSSEGAAILEIIHDLAPGAQLFFADASTDVRLASGRDFLLAKGVNVIVDDTTYIGVGRFDGTSDISRRAQEIVIDDGVSYVVAAGNQTPPPSSSSSVATSDRFPLFVNGYFTPNPISGTEKFHNFASGSLVGAVDEAMTISPVGGSIDIALTWDDVWDDENPRASDDLDIFLLPEGSRDISNAIASSVNLQNGSGLPFERITYSGDLGGSLVIRRKQNDNATKTLFTLTLLDGTVDAADSRYLTHGIALNNGDALPPVITVGAIDARTGIDILDAETVPGRSPGPGRAIDNSFVRWFTGQKSPSVVSYTNVSTASISTLTGSSASAAHIGGSIALLRAVFPAIPAYRYYDLLRTTTPPSGSSFPNAEEVIPNEIVGAKNAPRYLRPSALDTYLNVSQQVAAKSLAREVRIPITGNLSDWTVSEATAIYPAPEFSRTNQGLGLSANGKKNVYGYWETKPLVFDDGIDEPTTALRADRVYEVKARVGTTETDPTRVPDFRLRLTSALGDESTMTVVAGLDAATSNAPSSLGGKEYTLYFRPSNDKVAEQGVRFAFELLHFNEKDNAAATIFLQELTVREILPGSID